MDLFHLVDGKPDWLPEIQFRYPLTILESKRVPLTSHAAVLVDGRWRSTRWMDWRCWPCYRTTMTEIPLIYVSWVKEGRTYFRHVCPVCGNESNTMHVGWKPPTPNQ